VRAWSCGSSATARRGRDGLSPRGMTPA
jgi:hypothetical protein